MSNSDRQSRVNEINSVVVPNLITECSDDKLVNYSIQDLIQIQRNGRTVLDNEIFVMDEDTKSKYEATINKIIACIYERVKNADILYMIIDRTTNMPHIDDFDRAFVFSEEEFAKEAVDYYMQQYRMWGILEIPQREFENVFGPLFYMNGAKAILLDNGRSYIEIMANKLIDEPDFSNVPEESIPVMNPDYLRALCKLIQEKDWRANYEGKGKKLSRYENEMIRQFNNARFLVPTIGMEPTKEGLNTVTIESGTTIQIPTVSNGEMKATPVFTDWRQLRMSYDSDNCGGWIWQPKDLLSAPEDMVVVNIGEVAFPMSKRMISQMIEIYEREMSNNE